MGFSVSGSAAIIFAAMFVGFGMFHSATVNGFETVSDAQQDRTDRTLVQQNTAIEIWSATWDGGAGELTVRANNTGSTELSVDEVDLLADNRYVRGYDTSVGGDGATNLWLAQETLEITVTILDADPGRVKLITGPGVAVTASTAEVA